MSKSLQVPVKQLVDELTWLSKIKVGNAIPALKAVQISMLVGALRLRRTDYELFGEAVLTGSGGGQADILIDLTKLRAALKGLGGDASLSIADQKLHIVTDRTTVALERVAELDDWPAWPVFVPSDAAAAIVTAGELTRAMTSVGTDSTLPMLTGVRFEDGMMVTTDRFRLTRVAYDTYGKPFAALVPSSALQLFTRTPNLVTIEHGKLGEDGVLGGMVQVSVDNRVVLARTLDHDFPKWRQLVPDRDDLPVAVLIRRSDLLDAAREKEVTLTVTPESILVASSRDGVEMTQRIDVVQLIRGDGLPFTIRFNRELLAGCLRNISSGAVQFMASKPNKPALLQGIGDADLHLLMPIRMPTSDTAAAS